MNTLKQIAIALGLTATVALVGCESTGGHHDHDMAKKHAMMWDGVDSAVAVMRPTQGNKAAGWVKFMKVDGGVHVTAEITGLTPNSMHAIHVHQYGDATKADGTSAGGHYNPEGHDHGLPETDMRHAGDMGNLKADAKGKATMDLTFDNFSIAGTMNPVIGRGVIIHAEKDDGGQPTGNAGARIAIGVIGVANPGK